MYEDSWQVLKSMGHVALRIVNKQVADKITKATVDKYARTYRKAMQKEKYLDEQFRIKYPNAKIESVIDYKEATIRFVIKLNDFSNLREEDFNVRP